MRATPLLLGLLLCVTAACDAFGGSSTTSSTAASSTTSSTTTSTLATGACAGDFTSRGPVERLPGDAGDAVNITGIISESLEGCDRTTIQLGTASGAPATGVNAVSIEWLDGVGVLRVSLEDVVATAVSDQVLESLILDRLFVVRALDGSLFVDFVTSGPASARAELLTDPARVVIELVPSPDGEPRPPAQGGNVVVTSPIPTPASYPILIEGYSRHFEANVLARIDGELVGVTTAADWLETWGAFELVVDSGPDGPAELFVGEDSARDGSPIGVTIPLR